MCLLCYIQIYSGNSTLAAIKGKIPGNENNAEKYYPLQQEVHPTDAAVF